MKESTPPPLKERKEIRKEDCLNNYNNKKENSTKTTKRQPAGTALHPTHSRRGMKVPPAQQNIVTFNAYKPIDNTGSISYAEYERMKKAGKL